MLRFSHKSMGTLDNILKQKSYVFSLNLNCRIVQTNQVGGYYNTDKDDRKTEMSLGIPTSTKNMSTQVSINKTQFPRKRKWSWLNIKRTFPFFGISITCLTSYLIFTLGSPERDEDGLPIPDEFSYHSLFKAYFMRTLRELEYYRKLMKEPSREKLLPDPLQYPYIHPKYTLVLELIDILVHPDWSYNRGWLYKKRAFLDYFLESIKNHYEIVIYTAEQGMNVFPLIDAIDSTNIIAYKLVRDATHFTGGHHVKSLNNLNRDLSKVICIDWNANNVKFNPENLFCIKRWCGNDDDTSLLDLASFLKTIADNDIEDVREVIRVYSKYEDPIKEFTEKQKRLIDELEAQAAAKREQEEKKVSRWTPSFFRRAS